MLLIGNVNVENSVVESGTDQDINLQFELPRTRTGSAKLRLKYFGFHAGVFHAHPHYATRLYTSTRVTAANSELAIDKDYYWRHVPRSIRVKVSANGNNVLHQNTIVLEEINNTRETDFMEFGTTKSVLAVPAVDGKWFKEDVEQHHVNKVAFCGTDRLLDIGVGEIDASVERLDVTLSVQRDEWRNVINTGPGILKTQIFSGEQKVRLDTVSIVFELI